MREVEEGEIKRGKAKARTRERRRERREIRRESREKEKREQEGEMKSRVRGEVVFGFPKERNPWEKGSRASRIQPKNPNTAVGVMLKSLENARPSQFQITKSRLESTRVD